MNKHLLVAVFGAFAIPAFASAATYYNGNTYQSPQYRYSSTGASPSNIVYNSTQYQPASTYTQPNRQTTTAVQTKTTAQSSSNSSKGFYGSAGLSYEMASWDFSMNQAGSKLSYDNIGWDVLDVNLGYSFGADYKGLRLDGGIKYGIQQGDSRMLDDDISNGGYFLETYYLDTNNNGVYDEGTDTKYGDIFGNALSVGTSKSGSLFGFNVGLALDNAFKIGNLRITPSVGYRSLSYKLSTHDNYGLSVDTGYCVQTAQGEIQCDPYIIITNTDGDTLKIIWDDRNTPVGLVNTGGTYYYAQPGKSHEYNVTWAGPYIAFDGNYIINANNAFNARLEIGMPAYEATGDQPYRIDWEHPTSVKDTGSIGSAYHVGVLANWSTALTDMVALQIGFTYDYYTLSGANAKTYLSEDYYLGLYWDVVDDLYEGDEDAAVAAENPTVLGVLNLIEECPNWICKTDDEVDSIYKSLGIRVGVSAKF